MGRGGTARSIRLAVIGLGAWSLAFLIFLSVSPGRFSAGAADRDEALASGLMSRSIDAVRSCREAAGIPPDPAADLNRTGLIGLEASSITTSLGQLEAKRTSTNPAFAGAVVRMLREAGVRAGDTVAVGASSSFPGLIVAALCAARAMDLRTIVILSLGASNWGANDPRWTGLDIVACLKAKGLVDGTPVALSVGGAEDAGRDMAPEGREFLRRKITGSGIPQIDAAGLAEDVAARMELFRSHAQGAPLKAFINVGGSWSGMGTDAEILKLKPGTNPASSVFLPPPGRRGLIQEMAARGIPVIHLLFVRGLALRYGLPWDPVPFPNPAGSRLSAARAAGPDRRAGAALIYIVGALAGLFLIGRLRKA